MWVEFHISPNDYILKHYDSNTAIMLVFAIIMHLPWKENQLYFNLVLIYTNNKIKSKEGKRRNGLRHNFSFYQQNEMVVDNKGGMSEMDTHQRGSQSVTFINEERDVQNGTPIPHVEFSIGV